MQIERTEFLKELESVSAGLSVKETIEQSNQFVFDKKSITTFNDDISCSCKTKIKGTAAIESKSLLSLLRKLKDEIIEVEITDSEMLISGKNRKAGLRIEKEIRLPIDAIKQAKSWERLPKNFAEAVSFVQSCASSDDTRFELTCIHLTSTFIEACDGKQLARYKINLICKIKNLIPILIRRDSLVQVAKSEVVQFGLTKTWAHFRNEAGVVFSCRRYCEQYEDLTKIINVSGSKVKLPKELKEATQRAEVFSIETPDNYITVKLTKNKIIIRGKGTTGWYRETKKAKYKGDDVTFKISPILLREISNHSNQCEITDRALKVTTENCVYITALIVDASHKGKNKGIIIWKSGINLTDQ